MGEEWRRVESWRLVLLMGSLFAVMVTFQYLEIPYGRVLSSSCFGQNSSMSTESKCARHQTSGSDRKERFEDVRKDGVAEGMMGFDNSSEIDDEASPDRFSPVDTMDPSLETHHPSSSDDSFLQQNGSSPSEQGAIIGNSSIAEALPAVQRDVQFTLATPLPSDASTQLYKNLPVPEVKKIPEKKLPAVLSIPEMKHLLLQSRSSPNSMRPLWPSPVDKDLLSAKAQILNAPIVNNDPLLYAPIYRNVSMFKRSYELMEELLKVYIYKEGERPVFHEPEVTMSGIYASEGWFMKQMEANEQFVIKDSTKAHLFYLPYSSRNLVTKLYVPNSHSHQNLMDYLNNYVDMIAATYPFWNRTGGSDHFLVACHDWAAAETRLHMANCIRALCNSDVKEGYVFGKDVSLPETNVRTPLNPVRGVGGKRPSKRSVLAFFAGSMHGYLRPILLQHWENKDPKMKIFGRLPSVKGETNYIQYMKSSKYCICAKGYEVNSPRVVEAIMYECVPVIISDNFVPPFFEILDWESFSVFVAEKDIADLKNILTSIPERKYRSMQMRVKKVQPHFLWHLKPVKYDIFHMILHSIWYKRVLQMQP